jgi:hypothetical protein
MATLVSPGVDISVSDESFYSPGGPGTVPLIVIATAKNKSNPDGSGLAPYSKTATDNQLYLITSQRELLQQYGNPQFYSTGGTPQHGYELNEYGLLAAHSFLGLASRAYVLRADVDLDELKPLSSAPSESPANATIWVDSSATKWGIFTYDTSGTISKYVEKTDPKIFSKDEITAGGVPKPSVGKTGDIGILGIDQNGKATAEVVYFYKASSVWHEFTDASTFQSNTGKDCQFVTHLNRPTARKDSSALQSGDLIVQTTSAASGLKYGLKVYNTSTASWVSTTAEGYANSASAYASTSIGATPNAGTFFVEYDSGNKLDSDVHGRFALRRHNGQSSLQVQSSAALSDTAISQQTGGSDYGIRLKINNSASNIDVKFNTDTSGDGNVSVDDMVQDINDALASGSATNVVASNVSGKITLVASDGKDIDVFNGNVGGVAFNVFTNLNIATGNYSNFKVADVTGTVATIDSKNYEFGTTAPVGDLITGKLWYDSSSAVDIWYNKNVGGTATWTKYSADYDVNVAASEPTTQSDGGSLVDGDLWVDSDDLENYPKIYKRKSSAWILVDNTDQVSADGIQFLDLASYGSASVDADAIAPATVPFGILAWNFRASGKNVKKYYTSYAYSGGTLTNVWVSESGNKADGSPYMGRKAQRKVIVQSLQAAIANNSEIRSEVNFYNLISSPGYPELIDEMVTLNTDKKEVAFIVADSPMRLKSDATSMKNWATNANNASENGEDGLITSNPYVSVHYPSGLTTNLDGASVAVPASHIALRTFAFNDNVAYQWFAPAGYQRGIVQNATSVGYVDGTAGEFVPVSLNNGQRDTLYANKVNPIANFPGRGLVVFGQKTLNPTASALDRINVARLVNYIRYQLDIAVKPFLFEPNDGITRSGVKRVADQLLSELVTLRGLFDFISVCDTTNNTPARIDKNELYLDIAIQPTKAVEFIYIPIRIQSTLGQTGSE